MRNKEKYFVILFLLIIATIGAYILFIDNKPEISQLEKRKLSSISKINLLSWKNKEFQNSLENTLADHFIERNLWLRQYNKLEMLLNNVTDKFITALFNNDRDKQLSIQKVNEKVNLVTINGKKYLVGPSYVSDETTEKAIITNIDKINHISKDYKDVNFYVYLPIMANDTNLFNTAASGERYLSLFKRLEIPYKHLEVNTISQYEEMYFKTDHHWNHVGAYQGYIDIISLLFGGKEKPNSPMMKKTLSNYKFYGSLSAQTAHSVDIEGDVLCKYLFQLPPYSLSINGKAVQEYGNYSKYVNNEIENKKGFDHYNTLYQGRRGEIIFDTNRENYDNILIISDSYSNPIRDVISSHFNKSVFINLDMYNSEIGSFDLDQYIKEYKVKKVLVMVVLANYFPEGELKYLDAEIK